LAVDRPLDMLRTAVNVTGDSTVASIVATSENELNIATANDPTTKIN
ncbi:MAG: cation:dicarboxylase symporter family transporter, partial [Cyclobacteriaceae bacterium]|nr:cation:dicarboxylase symporter family transporter [Cyclobacteriaceae bacterium]